MARLARALPYLVAASFAITCIVHVIASVRGTGVASSPLRHAVFAAINAAFALLFAVRFRYTLALLVPLAGQQLVSHGGDLILAARRGELDAQSALVLAFLPLALGVAWSLWRRRDDQRGP